MARPSRATSRRRFLALVGAAGISSALVPVAALAQSATRGKIPRKPAARPVPVRPTQPESSAKPDTAKAGTVAPAPSEFADDATAMAAILERRYGKHLDGPQLEAVTRELDSRMQGGKALRAAKLANADEPDFTFHA